jgi:hypothetical protein
VRAALALLLLAGCQQRDPDTARQLNSIEERLSRIEARLINHATDERTFAHPSVAPPAPTRQAAQQAPASEAARYELVGLGGERRTYPTLVRCEIARSALIEEWAAVNERVRRDVNGRILHTPVTCVAL